MSAFRLRNALVAVLCLAPVAVFAGPPTASYAPLPDSYLPDGTDCDVPAFPAGGDLELDFGAGGNCAPGAACDIAVTSSQNGSGTGLGDRTIVGCNVVTLSGEGNAVAVSVVQDGVPGAVQLIGSQPGGGTIATSCNALAQNTTARVCCTESRGSAATVRPFWDVSCPSPTQPEFDAMPGGGTAMTLSTVAGTQTATVVTVENEGTGALVVSAGGLGGSLAVAPDTQQSIAPGAQQGFTITCAPDFPGSTSQVLSFATNDGNENPVTYPVHCTGTAPPAPEFESNPVPPDVAGIVTTEPATGQTTLVVSNSGTGALNVDVEGLDAPFGASPPSATIPAGGMQTFTITCAGGTPGSFFDSFTLSTNDTSEASVGFNVACQVNAAPTPQYGSVPSSPGPLAIATTEGASATATLTVSNPGDAPLDVSSVSGLAAPLSIAPGAATIPPGAQADFTVTCTGAAAGSFNGTLTVATNAGGAGAVPYDVGCEVTALSAPEINTVPAPGPLAMTTTPNVAGTAQVQVQNVGTAPLSITGTTGLAAPFFVSPTAPQTIAAGASRTFTVSCTSAATGTFNDALGITSNDANESPLVFPVQCTVNGIPDFAATPAPPGPLPISTTQGVNGTTTLRVSNAGSGPLVVASVTGLAAPFSISPGNATIAAGASVDFTITCASAVQGMFADTLTMNTNDPDASEAAVAFDTSCTAASSAGPPLFASTPASGSTLPALVAPVGSTVTTTISVSNTAGASNANLTIAATGLSAPLFVQPVNTSVAPGASRTLTIRCSPGAVGTSTQTLILDTNAPNVDPATYTASCEGTPGPEFNSVPVAGSTFAFAIEQGSDGAAILRVTNTGAAPLVVAPGFLAQKLYVAPNGPVQIQAGANFPFTVGCQGMGIGTTADTLVLSTNDVDEQAVFYGVTCRVELGKETRAAIQAIAASSRIPKPDPVFRNGFENP